MGKNNRRKAVNRAMRLGHQPPSHIVRRRNPRTLYGDERFSPLTSNELMLAAAIPMSDSERAERQAEYDDQWLEPPELPAY